MKSSKEPTRLRCRALRWVGMLILVLASGCGGHGGGGSGSSGGSGGAGSASPGDWDLLVWDQSNWS